MVLDAVDFLRTSSRESGLSDCSEVREEPGCTGVLGTKTRQPGGTRGGPAGGTDPAPQPGTVWRQGVGAPCVSPSPGSCSWHRVRAPSPPPIPLELWDSWAPCSACPGPRPRSHGKAGPGRIPESLESLWPGYELCCERGWCGVGDGEAGGAAGGRGLEEMPGAHRASKGERAGDPLPGASFSKASGPRAQPPQSPGRWEWGRRWPGASALRGTYTQVGGGDLPRGNLLPLPMGPAGRPGQLDLFEVEGHLAAPRLRSDWAAVGNGQGGADGTGAGAPMPCLPPPLPASPGGDGGSTFPEPPHSSGRATEGRGGQLPPKPPQPGLPLPSPFTCASPRKPPLHLHAEAMLVTWPAPHPARAPASSRPAGALDNSSTLNPPSVLTPKHPNRRGGWARCRLPEVRAPSRALETPGPLPALSAAASHLPLLVRVSVSSPGYLTIQCRSGSQSCGLW
ncbi:hypothetical protein Cadr_000030476 [Camelus dromedarius]|uniref:Uncharacterized protein n=1 Tax=Camelus dromedarius TaxID=9838 RepID=A0A5N4BYN4_CAMDR|nr:hypothetical protein Cadr_000030476 [Camelus dromedarius]